MILTKSYPASKSLGNVFDEFFGSFPAWENNAVTNTSAPVNINETENGYHLDFNVPGRSKEDFTVNVDKGLLTVGYESKSETEVKDVKAIRKEFSFKSFKRTFTLDEKVNADGIEARYENGLLKVFLPKKEEVKVAPKQISVQ